MLVLIESLFCPVVLKGGSDFEASNRLLVICIESVLDVLLDVVGRFREKKAVGLSLNNSGAFSKMPHVVGLFSKKLMDALLDVVGLFRKSPTGICSKKPHDNKSDCFT